MELRKKKVERAMVCVTRQKTCERLIREGARIAREEGKLFSVVHVVRSGETALGNAEEGEALEYLFTVSKQFGADMTMIRSDELIKALVNYATGNNVKIMILGVSGENGQEELVKSLRRQLPEMEFRVI